MNALSLSLLLLDDILFFDERFIRFLPRFLLSAGVRYYPL